MSANRAARGDTAVSAGSLKPFKQPIALDSIPRSTRLADSSPPPPPLLTVFDLFVGRALICIIGIKPARIPNLCIRDKFSRERERESSLIKSSSSSRETLGRARCYLRKETDYPFSPKLCQEDLSLVRDDTRAFPGSQVSLLRAPRIDPRNGSLLLR